MRAAPKAIACAAFAAGVCGSAYAADAWNPVGYALLEEMRGGFDAGSGLKISFGIEREGYINGKLVSATRLNIAGTGALTAGQIDTLATAVIRNGPANTVAGAAQPPAALVVQNMLNQQDIRSLTVINASANSLELIKGLNLQSALADALAQSLGSR